MDGERDPLRGLLSADQARELLPPRPSARRGQAYAELQRLLPTVAQDSAAGARELRHPVADPHLAAALREWLRELGYRVTVLPPPVRRYLLPWGEGASPGRGAVLVISW